jgi:hypothetical protein
LQENETKITTLHNRLAEIWTEINSLNADQPEIKSQISQIIINKNFLSNCLSEFDELKKKNDYVKRCIDFIATYKWKNVDEKKDDEDEKKDDVDENSLKTLPHDVFSNLKLPFRPLNLYTSGEIKMIAHYLKASELVTTPNYNYNNESPGTPWRSYGELLLKKYVTYDYGYCYISNSVRGCACGDDDCGKHDVCHADVVTPLGDIDLDTKSVIKINFQVT